MTYLDPRAIAERARRLDPPVVSLYVPAGPGTGDSAREAAVRAHAALVDLDIDVSLRRRVEKRLEIELARPRRGTLALFADHKHVVCGWLRGVVEADRWSGAAHAHSGPLDETPLWYLVQSRQRGLATCVDRDHAALFDVCGDEVVEIVRLERSVSDAEIDTPRPSKQERPAYVASRGGAALDNAHAHLAELARRFHQKVASAVRAALEHMDDAELIILGPPEPAAELESLLDAPIAARVAARLPGPAAAAVTAAEVRERVAPALRHLRQTRQRELLERVERSTIRGCAETLEALQRGQLEAVVAPWPLPEREVFVHVPTGVVALEPERARVGDGELARLDLAIALQRLVVRHGADLELVNRSVAEPRGLGDIAGLSRWSLPAAH